MYTYILPQPIAIPLIGDDGFKLRQLVADYLIENQNVKGAERGSLDEQSYGALAEFVLRSKLGMDMIRPEGHDLGYDILLPSGVKLDVKCRGGEKPFLEQYMGGDGLPRESKHNIFARQMYDPKLDAEIFLMTHLEHPKGATLPGTIRQRKWVLYVCGWISKKRIIREGVYLPPGSISERGREWFAYRAHQIEVYNQNLNGLGQITEILKIDKEDVAADEVRKADLNLTNVDALRITYDLVGRGMIDQKHLAFVKDKLGLEGYVGSFLHANQSVHVLIWLLESGEIDQTEFQTAINQLPAQVFEGF